MNMPDLITIPNGEKPQPTFSDAEMQNRLRKLRFAMAESKIDTVLFTSYHNINYYGDFLYCSFGRPYGLVVDDDKAMREMVVALLEDEGHGAEGASGADAAIERIREREFDAVISDIRMPGCSSRSTNSVF